MTPTAQCDACGRIKVGLLDPFKKTEGRFLCRACYTAAEYHCTSCKAYFTEPGKKGNGWIELLLYLVYLVPGIAYSIWRRSGTVCPHCTATTVIAASSGTHVKCPECAELVLREARKCRHCGCELIPQ